MELADDENTQHERYRWMDCRYCSVLPTNLAAKVLEAKITQLLVTLVRSQTVTQF